MITPEFVAFVRKRLHVHDALQGFLHDRRRIRKPILGFPGNPARHATKHHGHHGQQRKAHEHDARQFQRGEGDEGDAPNQECALADELRQDRDQRVLDLDQIGG